MHLPFSFTRRRTVRVILLSVVLLLPASAVFADPPGPELSDLETSDTDTFVVKVLPEPRYVAVVARVDPDAPGEPSFDSDDLVEPRFELFEGGFFPSDLEPREGNALLYSNPQRLDPAHITAQVTDIRDQGEASLEGELSQLVGINLVVEAVLVSEDEAPAGDAPTAADLRRLEPNVVIDAIEPDSGGLANLSYRFPTSDDPGFSTSGVPRLDRAPEDRDWEKGVELTVTVTYTIEDSPDAPGED